MTKLDHQIFRRSAALAAESEFNPPSSCLEVVFQELQMHKQLEIACPRSSTLSPRLELYFESEYMAGLELYIESESMAGLEHVKTNVGFRL